MEGRRLGVGTELGESWARGWLSGLWQTGSSGCWPRGSFRCCCVGGEMLEGEKKLGCSCAGLCLVRNTATTRYILQLLFVLCETRGRVD